MMKAVAFGILLFITSNFANADLIVTTNKEGDLTYVRIVSSYYNGNDRGKDTKGTCLVISGTQIMDGGNAKNCLQSSKKHEFKEFKENAKFTLNGQTLTGPLVVNLKPASNANLGVGAYDPEKAVAHLDGKGNLILVEQTTELPIDKNGKLAGGLNTASKVYTQSLTVGQSGYLPSVTLEEGGEQIFPGNVPAAPVVNAPQAVTAKGFTKAEKDAAMDVSTSSVDKTVELNSLKSADNIIVDNTTIDCGVKKGSDDFCSSIQNDKCQRIYLAAACDSKCPSGESCISAYKKMRSEEKFKNLINEINNEEQIIRTSNANIARLNKKKSLSDADKKILSDSNNGIKAAKELLYDRTTDKGVYEPGKIHQLNVKVAAESNRSEANECIPSVIKNSARSLQSVRSFQKVSTLASELKTCKNEASETIPKAPAGYHPGGGPLDEQLYDGKSAK